LKINSESLQPAKVHGHCLVAATVSNTPSRDDDVTLRIIPLIEIKAFRAATKLKGVANTKQKLISSRPKLLMCY
jgi:hypothetical protein